MDALSSYHAFDMLAPGKDVSKEAAWDLRDASPHSKVIITNDGIVARYISEDETSYFGNIQDDFTVAKKDASVETLYACDGKGIVLLSEPGTEPNC